MEIKERLKKIRNSLHLTQQEFADRLGIKRNTVATYETGKSNPSDSAVVLICREFNVNEEWLRTGKGEMFTPKPTNILEQLVFKYQLSNSAYIMIEKFLALRPEIQNGIYDYIHEVNIALQTNNIDPYAPAYTRPESPQPMDDLIISNKIQKEKKIGQPTNKK